MEKKEEKFVYVDKDGKKFDVEVLVEDFNEDYVKNYVIYRKVGSQDPDDLGLGAYACRPNESTAYIYDITSHFEYEEIENILGDMLADTGYWDDKD